METPVSQKKVNVNELSVVDLGNLFLEEVYRRAVASQVSWSYFHGTRQRLKRLCEVLGRDKPIAEVGKQELLAAVLHFAARPPCQDRPYQRRGKGDPISVVTAKTAISQMKSLFSWAADQELLAWERPRGFDRLFRLKQYRLRTAQEQLQEASEMVSGEVKTFRYTDLDRLFRSATSRERLFMVLGLNCGFTSGEVSSLRTFEVFFDNERPYIHKRRSKTGVEARWLLWPETAALLRKHKAPANRDLRWLLTEDANSLVEVNAKCRRDSIDQHWKQLIARAQIGDWMGFRFLRKTGANAIKRLGGLEESEMYLAHQETGLNKAYANRNWGRMWRCLEQFRDELPFLGPAWDLEPEECLFTTGAGMPWGDLEPPHSQHVTKRSELGRLNVSLCTPKLKRMRRFYVRVYRNGKTHCGGYFSTAEEAEAAAKALRLRLDGIHPSSENRPATR